MAETTYCTEAGATRPVWLGIGATKAALRLRDAQLAPQELAFTLEALRTLLPEHADQPWPGQVRNGLSDAFAAVGRVIRQPNNEGMVAWLEDCAGRVEAPTDLPAMLGHIQATLYHYGTIEALRQLEFPATAPA